MEMVRTEIVNGKVNGKRSAMSTLESGVMMRFEMDAEYAVLFPWRVVVVVVVVVRGGMVVLGCMVVNTV